MWTDISLFDIPEHQKTASFGPNKADAFTDIGDVCVVNSKFGKAKIRVIHPRKKRSLIWPLAALAVAGVAVIVWLLQETPKPPEPMRIIVKPLDREGTEQTGMQPLQEAPAKTNRAPQQAAPIKPPIASGPNAKATIVAKPVISPPALPPVKKEPAAVVTATNPVTSGQQPNSLTASDVQTGTRPIEQPVARPTAAIQPAATSAIKDESPVTTPVVEPLTGNNSNAIAPPSNAIPADQTATQPN